MPPRNCPLGLALRLLERKWVLGIIHELGGGPKRFSELEEALEGVNSSVLSTRLKELEKEQIIVRQVHTDTPPWAEYSLSEKGKSLFEALSPITNWANRWFDSETR